MNENKLVREGKEIELSKQLNAILLMFLEADNHRVNKTAIKKIWPKTERVPIPE